MPSLCQLGNHKDGPLVPDPVENVTNAAIFVLIAAANDRFG